MFQSSVCVCVLAPAPMHIWEVRTELRREQLKKVMEEHSTS